MKPFLSFILTNLISWVIKKICTMLTSFIVSRILCSFTTKNCVFLLAGLWKVSKNEGICARIHFGFKLSKWWLQCRTEFYKMVRNIFLNKFFFTCFSHDFIFCHFCKFDQRRCFLLSKNYGIFISTWLTLCSFEVIFQMCVLAHYAFLEDLTYYCM